MGISQQIGASSLIKPGVIDNSTQRPASPYEGQVIFQKDTDQMLVWNGTAWVIPNQTTANPEGLELITTFAIPSGASATIPNVFSATYDNYRIVVTGMLGGTPDSGYYIALGNSASGSQYYQGGYYINLASSTLTPVSRNNTSSILFGTSNPSIKFSTAFDICSPFIATETYFPSINQYSELNFFGLGSGKHNIQTSYTSFTISNAGSTLTANGTVRVYGYRNS